MKNVLLMKRSNTKRIKSCAMWDSVRDNVYRCFVLEIHFTQDYWWEASFLNTKLHPTDVLPKEAMGERGGLRLQQTESASFLRKEMVRKHFKEQVKYSFLRELFLLEKMGKMLG